MKTGDGENDELGNQNDESIMKYEWRIYLTTKDEKDTKARKGNEEDRIYGIKKAQKTQRIQKLDTDSRWFALIFSGGMVILMV